MSDTYLDSSLDKALAEQGEVVACSAGVSMYPMLRNKQDMIVVEQVKRELKKFDVPVYRLKSGKIVMHRILKVRPDVYIIRGDNLWDKEYVKPEQVIGVLKAFYRDGKYYDCATNKKYKMYVYWRVYTFYFRVVWAKGVKRILRPIKHLIFGKPQ